MQHTQVIFHSLSWISPESAALRQWTQVISSLMNWNALEQLKSCGSVSCLINTEQLELLHLQLSEPIAPEILLVHIGG